MNDMQKELNDINDEMLIRLITQLAKPTVTLVHLKEAASKYMEELEFRGACGRIWRAVKVYRKAMPNGQVVYWPEEKGRAVAASGIFPDMPEGAALPDYVRPNLPKEIAQEYKHQEHKQQVKDEKLTRKEENNRKSRWELVPISQTAALPMRPLADGKPGAMQRGTIRGEVASALFRYRDVRLSIDAVASLLPHRTRTDVAAVISQIVNGYGKRYFIRHDGATRFDNTYQWNHEFSYPFASRMSDDGEKVQVRNVDPEVEDDEPLDHLKPQELTEDETESEIARLLRQQQEEQKPAEEIGPIGEAGPIGPQCLPGPSAEEAQEYMSEEHDTDSPDMQRATISETAIENKPRPIRIDYNAPIDLGLNKAQEKVEEKTALGFPIAEPEEDDMIVRDASGTAIGVRGEKGMPGDYARTDEREILREGFTSAGVTVNSIGDVIKSADGQRSVEVEITPAPPVGRIIIGEGLKRADDSSELDVTSHEGIRRVKAPNTKFRVALFDDNEMVLHFGESTIELTSEQTDKIMSLLGPRYLAGLKAA